MTGAGIEGSQSGLVFCFLSGSLRLTQCDSGPHAAATKSLYFLSGIVSRNITISP